MRLRYVGPMPEVFVPAHDPYLDIARGDVVDFAEQTARDLLTQEGQWEPATKKTTSTPDADERSA